MELFKASGQFLINESVFVCAKYEFCVLWTGRTKTMLVVEGGETTSVH